MKTDALERLRELRACRRSFQAVARITTPEDLPGGEVSYVDEDSLREETSVPTAAMSEPLVPPDDLWADDTDTPSSPRKGWSYAEELACRSRCRSCGQRFCWGEVEYVFGVFPWKPRWIKLNPDMTPHACLPPPQPPDEAETDLGDCSGPMGAG